MDFELYIFNIHNSQEEQIPLRRFMELIDNKEEEIVSETIQSLIDHYQKLNNRQHMEDIRNSERLDFYCHYACATGNEKIFKIFLQLQYDFSRTDSCNGRNGFHFSCASGKLNIVQLFIRHGIDISTTTCGRKTGFIYACKYGHLNIVKFLVQEGCDISSKDCELKSGFHYACEEGHLEIVKYLMNIGYHIGTRYYGGSGLHLACKNGHENIVNLYITLGWPLYNLDFHGKGGFHYACMAGHVEIVQSLLENGYDILTQDRDGYDGLDLAVISGHEELVKIILEELVEETDLDVNDINEDEDTCLHLVCSLEAEDFSIEHQNLIQFFIDQGCGVNGTDRYDNLAIHDCIGKNNLVAAVYLLEQGSDFDFEIRNNKSIVKIVHERINEIEYVSRYGRANFIDIIADLIISFTVYNFNTKSVPNLKKFLQSPTE